MARENLSATYTITVFTFKLNYLEAVNCRVLINSKLGSIDGVETVADVEELQERIVLSGTVFILVFGCCHDLGRHPSSCRQNCHRRDCHQARSEGEGESDDAMLACSEGESGDAMSTCSRGESGDATWECEVSDIAKDGG